MLDDHRRPSLWLTNLGGNARPERRHPKERYIQDRSELPSTPRIRTRGRNGSHTHN